MSPEETSKDRTDKLKELVQIDKDLLRELIDFASDEIDTRISCLKDAGSDRAKLESEISDGQEVLAQSRTALDAQNQNSRTT